MTSRFLRPAFCSITATAFLWTAPFAPAQDTSKMAIQQNKADQQDVRQHTDVLATQIQGLIDELAENGISGDDIKVLNTTKAVLNNLSAQEMQKVIASLQQAGDAAGTKTGEQSLVNAYGTQKGIILQFRQILKDYEQRQAADVLPAKFKELTDRQTQTMWTTAQVATSIAGKSQQELNTMQQTTSEIVQSDQNALANDVATAKQMIDKAAQNATGDQGRALQQAQKDLASGKLQQALDKANDDLAKGHLLQATTEQKAARDQLRQLAKDLNPPTTTAAALADSAASLHKLIEEQKDLLNQTGAAAYVKPRVTGLDAKQGLLVDQANSLQEDMQALTPDKGELVKSAIPPMQIARQNLGPRGGSFATAEGSQQEAIDKLEAAAKQLDQQVADAQKAEADAAKDSTQKLQDLQNQLQQAQQQQQQAQQQTAQAAQNPNDPNAASKAQQQQQQLQQQAQAMQQAAAPLSLPAAQALAQAQQDMQQAQQSMTDPSQAQQTQQAQQAAQQALQQAQQAVAQQIAQNQQQATDPAQLAKAADQLQQAQNNVGQALANAKQQQQSPQQQQQQQQPATPPTLDQAKQQLQQAAKNTQDAAATPGLPEAAKDAVKDAQKSIAKGQEDAAKGDAKSTASDAAAAQSALAQAQAAVAVAQAGMTPVPQTQMAGGPPEPGQPNPNAPPSSIPGTQAATQIGQGPNDKGSLHSASGNGKFITVMSRERDAISETQQEKRPQEYSPMIDQYLKNLSDQATTSSQ